MRLYKQNDISKKVILYMVDDSDHVSPETGLTLTVRVSKNGGAFAAGAGSVAELEDGLYAYTFGAGDVDTLGPVVIKATATGADQCVVEGRVVAFDPDDQAGLGLFRLDTTITSRLAAADVPNNFKDLAITETEGKVTVDNVDDCKATGFSTHSPEDVKSAIESEGSKLSIVHSKLPLYGIADQSLLTAIGNSLVEHRNIYSIERAMKLDNLDATITSRLAANAVPAHFGDLAITETTGKVTVNNVDECKADVSGLATSAEIAALHDFDPATEKVEIAGTKNRLDDLNDIDGSSVTVTTNNDKTGYALTAAYDAAKTAAQAGDAMTLTSGERSSIAAAVWSATTRTLSSFGSLVLDVITGVWSATTRTLTAGTRDSQIDAITAKLPSGDIADQLTSLAIKSQTDKLDFSGDGGMLKSESVNLPDTPAVSGEYDSDIEAIEMQLSALTKLGQYDVKINKATTPWQEEYYEAGTSTLLFAKKLYDIDGNPITSIDTYAAYKQQDEMT